MALDAGALKSLARDKDFTAFMAGVKKGEPSVAAVHTTGAGGDRRKVRGAGKPVLFTDAIREVHVPKQAAAAESQTDDDADDEGDDCETCGGEGQVSIPNKRGGGSIAMTCPGCGGTGAAPDSTEGAVQPIDKAGEPRSLKPRDDGNAHTPFPHDPNAFANLRDDQVPRFLGAITNPDDLEMRNVPMNSLVAMQNRVDPVKVDQMVDSDADLKPPVVVRMNGKNLIADGHHRAAAAWMKGDNKIDVRYANLTGRDNALKRVVDEDFEFRVDVRKVAEDQHRIFGFASVVTKAGKMVVDHQDDAISPADMEEGVYDFVLSSRAHGDMHEIEGTGRLIESAMLTIAKQEAMGIVIKDADGDRIEPWWVGFQIDDAETWAAHKRGDRPELSIGGSGVRVPYDGE